MTPIYPYSTHSFMLPVRWDYLRNGYDPKESKESIDFDERTKLSEIIAKLKKTAWRRTFYRINQDPLQYNELSYFHAYTSKSIFDLQQENEKNEEIVNETKTMVYFEIETIENDKYLIETLNHGKYELKLTGLSLHIYYTGVAILTINLENYKHFESEKFFA